MAALFRRTRGKLTARFDDVEAAVLRAHVRYLNELLGEEQPPDVDNPLRLGSPDAPSDPALHRLFPDAYRDDDEAAGEFRRFTEGDLRAAKVSDAGAVLAELGPEGPAAVSLDVDRAERWLRALNDVRLLLGVRLDVSEDPDADLAAAGDDPVLQVALSHYAWLGWLQESLLEGLGAA